MITGFILNPFENKMLLEPVVGGVPSVAHVITGHEQTQSNRVCCYLFLGVSFLSKDLTIQNLFIFAAADVVKCGGRKTSPRTSL